MKKKEKVEGEVRRSIDFSKAIKNPYAARIRDHGSNLVLIEPELYALFPSSDAVNEALRLIAKASAKAVSSKAVRQAKAS